MAGKDEMETIRCWKCGTPLLRIRGTCEIEVFCRKCGKVYLLRSVNGLLKLQEMKC